ncbi:MAG TPA: asparagine synthase (glutamine-hydrolyzing) [Bryobacteraceae bacterium]|nr:asparagine synthase (glutamine-hydrolyzing) [Bryobacteraceae bacterium]
MCGIAGCVSFGRSGVVETRTRQITGALARRGPDSSGIATWPGVALGHRRLAILDLSPAGHQPMLSEDKQIGVVFNGCIYNFLELRKDLEQRGHVFRSNCDTEVLVAGYRQWGVDDLVHRCRGMFAFAVWDQPERKLTLVRDRLGVKPLVWWSSEGEIAFASTLAALRAGGMDGPLDEQAVLEFLEYGFVTDERAIWRGMHKLPPATILEWHDGRIAQREYWNLTAPDGHSKIGWREAVEETERLLVESVRLRLCSDVPIGALLSGGVDSSLVCWALAETGADVTAFTVGAPGDPADETESARSTARRLGLNDEVVTLPERAPMLDEVSMAFSEPFACQSAQAMLQVSQAVKPHATVLLTGDGGDDVFFGYPFFKNVWRAQRTAQMLPEALAKAARGVATALPIRRIQNFLDCVAGGVGPYARLRDGLPYFDRYNLFGPRLKDRRLAQREIEDSFKSARRLLWDAFALHKRLHFTSEFMPKVDGSTMYYSLEARSPLLDHKLWEFSASLPADVQFHGGRSKAVLREIARRRVGEDVARRSKQGFTVPAERWLAGRWAGSLDILRDNPLIARDGWIRAAALGAALDEALRKQWVPPQLTHLLVLEHWLTRNQGAVDIPPVDREDGTTIVRA